MIVITIASRCVFAIIVPVFAWTFSGGAAVNWHSSHAALRLLYDLQDEQLTAARAYLASETDRIRDLENLILSISEMSPNNSLAKNSYLLAHINGAQLVKRIYTNQLKVKNLLNNEKSIKAFENFDENKSITEPDVHAMYRSLRRLQKAYAIPASEMAAGRRDGRVVGDPMDASECYAMVEHGFQERDMFGVVEWAIQTYEKWLIDRRAARCGMDGDRLLLYYIESASTVTGFNYKSLPYFEELRQPENEKKFDQHLSLMAKESFLRDVKTHSDIYETYNNFEADENSETFRRLCATGKSERPLTNDSKCRFQTKNSPYRTLMPFKEEDISKSPYIKVYHDVIYDEEISFILGLAKKDLIDAKFYTKGKSVLIEDKRLGQLKWLSERMNPELFGKLDERIECLTDYTTETAEKYQLVNYGVGGHFSLHVDTFSDMTDVPDDGYTVFPKIKYAAHCRKGSAVVWHNVYLNNGTVHSGTLHGGCPIVKGNKWILTKALFENKQPLPYDWRTNTKVVIV